MEDKYWRSEYENLRRRKKKEIEDLRYQAATFVGLTFQLLTELGMKPSEINEWYRVNQEVKYDRRI